MRGWLLLLLNYYWKKAFENYALGNRRKK